MEVPADLSIVETASDAEADLLTGADAAGILEADGLVGIGGVTGAQAESCAVIPTEETAETALPATDAVF